MTALLDAVERDLAALDAAPAVATSRAAALRVVQSGGLPNARQEDWRYTDLAPLARGDYRTAPALALDPATLPLKALTATRVVFVNGRFEATCSTLERLPAGARVRLLDEMSRHDPAWLADHLARQAGPGTRAFVALNAAAAPDGLCIELSPGTRLSEPLLVLFVTVGSGAPSLCSPRLELLADRESRAELLEVHVVEGSGPTLTNAFTRLTARDGAQVAHYRVLCGGVEGSHIGTVEIEVGRDARVDNFSLALGGHLTRVDLDCRMTAPGGELTLKGVFTARTGEHVDHHTRVEHAASHTTSAEVYKGIADGNGRGVFNGRILVCEGVEKIVATQTSHNLLLSADAEIDTKPELEIHADDLRCSHGATVGQLDEDSLFYLRSRGVPVIEARALLVYGFVQSLVEEVPYPALQALVAARITEENPALAGLLSGLAP